MNLAFGAHIKMAPTLPMIIGQMAMDSASPRTNNASEMRANATVKKLGKARLAQKAFSERATPSD
ncbi:hypothetical protein [Dyella terrae]|uniref:hypothetical protein n=1 Tax=Dyella terrae TaxID=522259 RepID=UPI001EFD180C|nr:hypothetical protein [Dyella terrae]ULU25297.1 hypothetical protein DYST_02223 [Dyella terrae]